MSLSSIDNFCGQHNIAGLVRIEYAPTHWIYAPEFERVVTEAGNWQYAITFTTGSWLTASARPAGRLWNEAGQNAEQGVFYQQEVRGIAPKLRPAVARQLGMMEKMGFLLKLTDRNGNPWILGTLENPFFFLASATSGDEAAGLNNYELIWTSSTQHRAAGFVPVLPE